jgi:hypothetical protein
MCCFLHSFWRVVFPLIHSLRYGLLYQMGTTVRYVFRLPWVIIILDDARKLDVLLIVLHRRRNASLIHHQSVSSSYSVSQTDIPLHICYVGPLHLVHTQRINYSCRFTSGCCHTVTSNFVGSSPHTALFRILLGDQQFDCLSVETLYWPVT